MNRNKICPKCNQCKSYDNFGKNKSNSDGLSTYCKLCRCEYRKVSSQGYRKDEVLSETKICTGCDEEKSHTQFNKDRYSKDGLQTYCKQCKKIRQKDYLNTFDGYIKYIYGDLKSNAKKRNIKVEITEIDIVDMYKRQGGKCALTNFDMTYIKNTIGDGRDERNLYNISVDRFDSSGDYTIDNIQLVCSGINTMKWDLSTGDFIVLCEQILQCTEVNN